MITGKVTDKATNSPIPAVKIYLTDMAGQNIVDDDGPIVFTTNAKGEFAFEMIPGQMVYFEKAGYPLIEQPYEVIVRNGKIVMDDGTGTALQLNEVKAFIKDATAQANAKWLIGVGILLMAVVITYVLAKKQGWIE